MGLTGFIAVFFALVLSVGTALAQPSPPPPLGYWQLSGACSPVSPPSGGFYDSTSLVGSTASGGTLFTADLASPDCTTDGSTFIEDTSNGTHSVYISGAEITHTITGASVTLTIYTHSGAGSRLVELIYFDQGYGGSSDWIMNPSTCATYAGPSTTGTGGFVGSAVSTTLTVVGSWCKATLTTTPVTVTGIQAYIFSFNATTGSDSYTGDNTSSLGYWGVGLTSP